MSIPSDDSLLTYVRPEEKARQRHETRLAALTCRRLQLQHGEPDSALRDVLHALGITAEVWADARNAPAPPPREERPALPWQPPAERPDYCPPSLRHPLREDTMTTVDVDQALRAWSETAAPTAPPRPVPTPPTPPPAGRLEQLAEQVRAHGAPIHRARLTNLLGTVERLANDVREHQAGGAEREAARQRVAELEEQLAEARRKARPAKRPLTLTDEQRAAKAERARRLHADHDYDTTAVRAWAREHGLDVPTRGGNLPARVVDAWRAANGGAA